MGKPVILCVDDQRAVLSSLEKDLELFTSHFFLEPCESASEADEVLEDLYVKGTLVPLIICDHVMPERTGIDFMTSIQEDDRFVAVRKILLTGMANQKDTIKAINQGGLDYYIEKPWDKNDLVNQVKIQITRYMIATGVDYKGFLPLLDQQTLYTLLQEKV